MPRFKGSCGCYSREAALELGLPAAILLNWLEDKYTHYDKKGELVDGMFWADQTGVADELAFEIKMLYRAIEKLEEHGILIKRVGYRPNSTVKTTWWGLVEYIPGEKSMGVSESTKMGVSIESTKMGVSILNNTNNNTNGGGGILDYGIMKALIQKFVREHQSQSNPITFTPSKLKEYYPSLKEWAIDNGINLDRAMVNTVLENAYSEMTNDGWLAGKDIAIAFKDTCIGTRIKKQQKKGGLNDNEW